LALLVARVNVLTDEHNVEISISYIGTGLFDVESVVWEAYGKLAFRGVDLSLASYIAQVGDAITVVDAAGDVWTFTVDSIAGDGTSSVELICAADPTLNGDVQANITPFADVLGITENDIPVSYN